MPKSQFLDFKAVKAAVSMEQVLQHYGLLDRLKRHGDSLSGPCPIHGGVNPSQFRVSLSKNCWNCFGDCKSGGNVLDFVAKKDDLTLHAAARKLVEWFNLSLGQLPGEGKANCPAPEKSRPATDKPARPEENGETPNKPLGFRLEHLDRSHPYLTERGLTLETIVDFGLGYCAKGMMSGRVAIPIHTGAGQLVAYCGRWPGEPPGDTPKYKFPPGFRKSLELFNLDRASRESADKPLVIVEGFFDVIKLHQLGCRKVVALMGSSLSTAQEQLIRQHTHALSQVIVMLDEDDAGRAGRDEIALRLAKFVFVHVHVFEPETSQPEHLGVEELAAILGGAL